MWRLQHRALGRRQKRIRELSRQGWRVWVTIAGFLLLIWGGALSLSLWNEKKLTASDNLPEIALVPGADLVYDLQQLQPDQTRFFSYPVSSSERSRLLVTRDAKGGVRVAFATCTVCYADRREHRLKEGQLICGRCQTSMRIGDPNEKTGPDKGCVAVPVPFSVENNKIVVHNQAITAGLQALVSLTDRSTQRDGDPKGSQSPR